MIVSKIATKINEVVASKTSHLANIQAYRSALLGQAYRYNYLFGQKAVKDDGEYAYHHGGRKEIQFNIGFLEKEGKKMLYYGLALSFEGSRDVPNPLEFFEPHRQRLNALIKTNPEQFDGMEMCFLSGEIRKKTRKLNGPFPIREIPSPQLNDFFIIGKWAEIPQSPEEPIFEEIAQTFEQLFPIYWIGTFDEEIPGLENRLARLCYNTNHWKQPSGREGKSNDTKSYEYRQGHGHEEWFFDVEKLIDGWHYAFLRPVSMYWASYVGKKFDVKLYTRTPGHEYQFVGFVKGLEVISKIEAKRVIDTYVQNGWLNEMNQQLNALSLNTLTDLDQLFNVRFRPEDAQIFDPYEIAEEKDIPFGRYMFYKGPKTPVQSSSKFIPNEPNPQESDEVALREIQRVRKESETWHPDIHSAIQDGLHRLLKLQGPTRREAVTADGKQRIDLKFQNPDGRFTLYEIKTYDDLRTCVRTALGQLLEYAYFDDFVSISQLVIVSQHPCGPPIDDYFRHLRETLNLPISYLQFDYKTGKILQDLRIQL